MAKKKLMTPLEEFSAKADRMGMQYGKYTEYLYREACRKKRERKRKKCQKQKS